MLLSVRGDSPAASIRVTADASVATETHEDRDLLELLLCKDDDVVNEETSEALSSTLSVAAFSSRVGSC